MGRGDRRSRSVVKAFTWRFLATLTTISLVFIFTRNITLSLEVGVFDVAAKLLIYYFHERAWNIVGWGKV